MSWLDQLNINSFFGNFRKPLETIIKIIKYWCIQLSVELLKLNYFNFFYHPNLLVFFAKNNIGIDIILVQIILRTDELVKKKISKNSSTLKWVNFQSFLYLVPVLYQVKMYLCLNLKVNFCTKN